MMESGSGWQPEPGRLRGADKAIQDLQDASMQAINYLLERGYPIEAIYAENRPDGIIIGAHGPKGHVGAEHDWTPVPCLDPLCTQEGHVLQYVCSRCGRCEVARVFGRFRSGRSWWFFEDCLGTKGGE